MTTKTSPPGEVHVPHFKERLRHELVELHARHADHQQSRTGAVKSDGRPRRPHRPTSRRSIALSVLGSAAAAGLVIGILAANGLGRPSDRPAGTLLMERIATATGEAVNDSVIHVVEEQVTSDGKTHSFEQWIDARTGVTRWLTLDPNGNAFEDVGPLTGPTVGSPTASGQRVVDYCTRQYVDHGDTGEARLVIDGAGSLQSARDEVAEGRLVEDGTEIVAGRELIRLRGMDMVLLVEPDTYRVVGQRGTFVEGGTYDKVYEYFPRTHDNLALLMPPIPDGFTRVDPHPVEVRPGSACDGS